MTVPYSNRPTALPGGLAVGPAVSPSPSGLSGRSILQKEKAGSTGPSLFDDRFGLTPSLPCKAQEGSAQLWKLYGGAFVALRRSQVVLTRDAGSVSKTAPNHFAHRSLSKFPSGLEASL